MIDTTLWPPGLALYDNLSVGVDAIEYYAPTLCVSATDVEDFHGSPGRYTIGRG